MSTIASLVVELLADTGNFTGNVQQAENTIGNFGKSVATVGAGLSVGLTAPIVAAGIKAVGAASDIQESIAKTGVIFGDAAGDIISFSENTDTALGQSQQSALDAATTFGVFGKAAGLSGQDLSGFSTELVTLASDLASFHNTSPEQAIVALGAALRGETEPIRAYGVLLDDASLRQKALEMGIVSTTKEALTPQQKVLAAHALIMEQTADAQGDFARTSDGLANSQRTLSAQFDNLVATLGQNLLPIGEQLVGMLNQLVSWFSNLSPETQKTILMILGIVAAVGPLLVVFGTLITSIGAIVGAFGAVGGAIGTVIGVISGPFLAIVGVIILAIMAIVAVGYVLYTAWTQNWGGIQEKVHAVVEFIRGLISAWLTQIQAWWTAHKDQIMATVQAMWNTIQTIIQTILKVIQAYVEFVLGALEKFWSKHGDSIMKIAKAAWDFISKLIDAALKLVSSVVSSVLSAIQSFWDAHGAAIMAAAETAWETIKSTIEGVLDFIGSIIDAFASLVEGDWEGFLDHLKTAWQTGWDTIKGVLQGMISALGGIITSIVNDIKSKFDIDWGAIGDGIVDGIANGISNGANAIINAAKSAAQSALDAAKQFLGIASPSKAFTWLGQMAVEGFINPFKRTNPIEAAGRGLATAAVRGSTHALAFAPSGSSRGQTVVNYNVRGTFKAQPEMTVAQKLKVLQKLRPV